MSLAYLVNANISAELFLRFIFIKRYEIYFSIVLYKIVIPEITIFYKIILLTCIFLTCR